MAALEESPSSAPQDGASIALVGAILSALVSGLLAFLACALAHVSLAWAALVPLAVIGAAAFLWNTHYGLCFAAFAIAPLGVVQHEIASITLNLPEVLILMLVVKEGIRFVARKEPFAPCLPVWPLALYLLGSIVGLVTGFLNGYRAAAVLQDFRQYTEYIVLYLLVLHRVSTKREMTQILVCFVLGMTLVGIHGIIQRFTGIGIPGYQALSDAIYHKGIRSGSFYGATPLGAMMVFAFGTSIGLGLASRFWAHRVAFVGLTGIAVVAAVFTNTRASWLAVAFTFLVIFFSVRKTRLLVAVSVLGLAVFCVVLGPMVIQRMEKLEVSKRERSLLQRVRYYTAAWRIFREYPVQGLGWGCSFSIQDINVNKRFVPPMLHDRIGKRPVWAQSTVHSAYLQILARTGLLGLLPFLWFLARWLHALPRERARGAPNYCELDHKLLVAVSAAVMGYLLHSGLENFFQWPVMSQSFWLLMGLTTVMAYQLTMQGAFDRGATTPSGAAAPAGA